MQEPNLKDALHGFLESYLIEQRQFSLHTIKSYRDTFKLLIEFAQRKFGASVLAPSQLDVPLILNFLKHLQDSQIGRANSAATRNQRLACIRSFFKYLAWQYPTLARQAKRIRAIPMKRSPIVKLDFLTRQEIKALFAQVDTKKMDGFRDFALLTYLYNTGARSQEAAHARISWLNLKEQTVSITGKGNKVRLVPLWATTVKAIETYIRRHRRNPKAGAQDFLFLNQRGGALTRFGVRCIVRKYLMLASAQCESLRPKRLSTHSLRHTTAMHLLESGVELNVIKAWLGHANLDSTSRYIDSDFTDKKKALEKFAPPIYVASSLEQSSPSSADQVLDWLNDL